MMWVARRTVLLLHFAAVIVAQNSTNPSYTGYNYAQYVNPFIGSEGPMPGLAFGGGDIFVGGK